MDTRDKEFHTERTLYYKRLRDNTDNPELYVAYEKEMRYHFDKYRSFVLTNMARRRMNLPEV